MSDKTELEHLLLDLQRTTGLNITVTADSDTDIEKSITAVKQLTHAYKEKYNKTYFLQQVLLGNVSAQSLSSRAKKLHLSMDERRTLILLETRFPFEDSVPAILSQLFPSVSKNHVIPMDANTICILAGRLDCEDMEQMANTIVDTLNAEAMTPVFLSYTKPVDSMSDLNDAYRETAVTLQIRKLFYPDKSILPSNQLGIGRLIYGLPLSCCEEFLSEIFNGRLPDQFDEEITTTINTFFQTNLNIAETSRQLHVHRNTLIYRLEQLEKHTGLDIRRFEDAMTFKIATMVINYIHAKKEF